MMKWNKAKNAKSPSSTAAGTQGATSTDTGKGKATDMKVAGVAPLPLIGHLPFHKQYRIAGVVFALFLTAAAGSAWVGMSEQRIDDRKINSIAAVQTLGQQAAKASASAVRGDVESIKELEAASQQLNRNIVSLQSDERSQEKIKSVVEEAGLMSDAIKAILDIREEFEALKERADLASTAGKTLTYNAESLSALLQQEGASGMHQSLADHLFLTAGRLGETSVSLLTDPSVDVALLAQFSADYKDMPSFMKLLLQGDAKKGVVALDSEGARAQVREVQNLHKELLPLLDYLDANAARLVETKQKSQDLLANANKLIAAAGALETEYKASSSFNYMILMLAAGLMGLAIGAVLVMFSVNKKETMTNLQRTKAENEMQQAAITLLLEEIGSVADGDLTVKATVNDNFAGAIADSFNYTIAELRRVIMNITETAQRVSETSKSATDLASQMSHSAKDQFSRLAVTGDHVRDMSTRMDEIAQNTAEVTGSAKQSVDVAHRGREVVDQSISKMNQLREAIQETSKKIKLLGESSTAIGEVTGLIRDITKQINILALNAAIQSASAGEAGRGFAVVAQEVQRLARSSAEAAKRIDDLVVNIQEDAKVAVASMEESTMEVVEGAKLADRVDVALKEIGVAIDSLARSVEQVTTKIEDESGEATNVAMDMRLLQELTEKAMEDIQKSAEASSEVKVIAGELKESVSNFRV